jgi:DNA-binding NarL/FixJ family response regulator
MITAIIHRSNLPTGAVFRKTNSFRPNHGLPWTALSRNLLETQRIVFVLRDIEGLSIQETSRVLNLSETTVKTRLLRARLRLREDLSTYYGERLDKWSKK